MLPIDVSARSAPLEKGLSNILGKIHIHEKETVCFLPGWVGCTNNFDLPPDTNLIRISLPRLWFKTSKTVEENSVLNSCNISWRPRLLVTTNIAKSIRLEKKCPKHFITIDFTRAKINTADYRNQRYWLPSLFVREKTFLFILYNQERVLCASLNIFDGQSELHMTDILEYGEARSQCNFHEPATCSDI